MKGIAVGLGLVGTAIFGGKQYLELRAAGKDRADSFLLTTIGYEASTNAWGVKFPLTTWAPLGIGVGLHAAGTWKLNRALPKGVNL